MHGVVIQSCIGGDDGDSRLGARGDQRYTGARARPLGAYRFDHDGTALIRDGGVERSGDAQGVGN